eukprot:10886266-Lingulodinium_polyedra.AAC.1
MRLRGVRAVREANANRFLLIRVARYWEAGQALMQQGQIPMFYIAWDATRVSGKDMLYTCMANPSLPQAMWLPPQVLALSTAVLCFSEASRTAGTLPGQPPQNA